MKTLKTIGLTNGEHGEIQETSPLLLQWMKMENEPIPQNGKDLDKLLTKWILFTRLAAMEHLRNQGKISQAAYKRFERRNR